MTEFRTKLAEACKAYAANPGDDRAAMELLKVTLDWPLDDPAMKLKIVDSELTHRAMYGDFPALVTMG
jgi:hypothetical protein